ncbi:MAG: hypothetical protein JW925_06500 [Syntrophaceae bacterium]|nr:hypothetical protein [Syntrophaceae bacterium]
MQGDEQKPDTRCGKLGTSPAAAGCPRSPPSAKGVCLITQAFMHRKLRVLPREIFRVPWMERCVRGELAEGGEILPDRAGEVSPAKKRRDKLLA